MMNLQISLKDQELLCAYLDNELSNRQRIRLDARLQNEPELHTALIELSRTKKILQTMPKIKSPRNFALTREMICQPRIEVMKNFFRFRMVSAIASFLLILILVGDFLNLPGQVKTPEAVPQMVMIQEKGEIELPDSEAHPMEAQNLPTALMEEIPEAMVSSEELLKGAPSEEQRYPSSTESDTFSVEESITVLSEVELLAEAEPEKYNLTMDIPATEVAVAEGTPEVEGGTSLVGSSTVATASLGEVNSNQELGISSTAVREESLESTKQEERLAEDGEILQSEQAEQITREIDNAELTTNRKKQVFRFFEILLGLIALGGGILAVYFYLVGRNVS